MRIEKVRHVTTLQDFSNIKMGFVQQINWREENQVSFYAADNLRSLDVSLHNTVAIFKVKPKLK